MILKMNIGNKNNRRYHILEIVEIIQKKFWDIVQIGLMSSSITFILFDIVHCLKIDPFYMPYLSFVPLLLSILVYFFIVKKYTKKITTYIYYSFLLSILEYLICQLFGKIYFEMNTKICIYSITIFCVILKNRIDGKIENNDKVIENKDDTIQNKTIFSLYYINTDKVYEIAMLLNNRIVTGGSNENETESQIENKSEKGINTNLNYLEIVKGDLGVSQSTQISNGIKNRVLENFDVKTTKSNMLAEIISKAKSHVEGGKLQLGDLVLFKNASLTLLNQEESYAVTKMILNGAFKDTKISSNSDDMKIELDLSAMINSLLKDCAYELGCSIGNDKYMLTIPMTFENDFENSYNIYDLQVGTVTIVGIYRGKRKYRKRLSLQEMFAENGKENKKSTYENSSYHLQSSKLSQTDEQFKHDLSDENEYQNVIDVIAIIQEINAGCN